MDRLGVKTVALATTEHVYYDDPVIYEDHLSRHRQLYPLLAAYQCSLCGAVCDACRIGPTRGAGECLVRSRRPGGWM